MKEPIDICIFSAIRQRYFCIVLLLSIICLGSCGMKRPDTNLKKSGSLRDTILVANDSENIACTIGGTGSITLFFVHGWCIDKSYWKEQMAHFAPETKTVCIDLPGFGDSGKGRKAYSISKYADDVSKVIHDLDLKNVVLVGHSMSGDIVLETALMQPEVIAIIGVDNFKDIDLELNAQIQEEIDHFMKMLTENYAEIASAYAEQSLFHESTNPKIRADVLDAIQHANPQIATACLEAVFEYGKAEKERLSGLKQKLYLINTDTPPTNQKALRKLGIDYAVFPISKSGHYPMVERPEQFDRALEAILSDIRATNSFE